MSITECNEGYDRGNRGGSNSVGTNEGYERSSVAKQLRRRPQTLDVFPEDGIYF